ncbi:MAG: hypothetical protein AB8G15_03730 [Saprospiraceae bacterium]
MKGIKGLLCLVGIVLLGFSCGKTSLSPKQYVDYVTDSTHGLRVSKTVGDLVVELQYRPIPFVVANELRRNDISAATYQARLEALEGGQYYHLKLAIKGGQSDVTKYKVTDENAYQQRIHYLSFALKNDIHLVDGRDTLRAKLFHFERAYDIAKYRSFLLSFPATDNLADKVFIFESPIFETGPLKLRFKKEDLEDLPDLKLVN